MIHKYQLNGYNIVIDVNSGAVHVVDDMMYEMLENVDLAGDISQYANLMNKYASEDIAEAFDEIKAISENDELFSADDYDMEFVNRSISPIKAMCLNVAHDCNLVCEYCFASKGDFGKGRQLMSYETGKLALDFLIAHSGGRTNLEVDFFGGEPLMNFEVVKQLVAYGRQLEKEHKKRFRFTITTNGILLNDENIEFINKEMHNVVLSIDGRKIINDQLRVSANGSGSFDIIVPKYQQLVAGRGDKEYYVRGTFTTLNKDFTKDVLALYEHGFKHISVEPVVSDPKLDFSIKENDLPEIFAEYEELTKKLIEMKKAGESINFFHFFIDLNQGPCAIKRLRGCGCGNEYVAITPDGEIYPCHQFVGEDKFIMGNIFDQTFDENMKKGFSELTIYHKSECKKCWAKFYCSGGCAANNVTYSGELKVPHTLSCELEKKRLECAIMMQVALDQ